MSTDTTPLSLDSAAALFARGPEPEQAPETAETPETTAQQPAETEQEAVEAPEGDPAEETETDAEAPEEQAAGEVDADEGEAAQPSLEPPAFWSKADKEIFTSLPPEAQQAIVTRDKLQQAEISRLQSERAAESKAIAERQAALEQDRQQIEQLLMAQLPQPPDEKLIETDPQGYLRQRARYEAEIGQIQQIVAQNEVARAEQQKKIDAEEAEHRKAETDKLKELIPELSDPQSGPKLAAEIKSYGKSQGYDDATLALANASDFLILSKAMKWDKAQAAAKAAKTKPVPKVAAPGVGRTKAEAKADQRKSLLARLERSGSIEDAVAALRT